MNYNISGACLCMFVLMLILGFCGEPDLVDALISNLMQQPG